MRESLLRNISKSMNLPLLQIYLSICSMFAHLAPESSNPEALPDLANRNLQFHPSSACEGHPHYELHAGGSSLALRETSVHQNI